MTRVVEGGCVGDDRESSEKTVENDEVEPPIIVEIDTNNILNKS